MVKARFVRLAILSCCLARAPLAAAEGERSDVGVESAGANEATARELFAQGVESVRREAWAEAEAAFERSATIVARPSTLYNLALCRYRLDRNVEALDAVERLLNSAEPADASTREHAETLRQRALERVLVVEVTVEPTEATISVDGVALERDPAAARTLRLVPGQHVILVSAPGRIAVRLEVEGAAGQTLARSVALAAVAPAGSSAVKGEAPQPLPPASSPGVAPHWILMGAGALMLASAAVTGAIAWKADSDFVADCQSLRDCDRSNLPLRDRASTFAIATDVLLGLGLATGGVGAVLYWKAESSAHSERAIGLRLQGSL